MLLVLVDYIFVAFLDIFSISLCLLVTFGKIFLGVGSSAISISFSFGFNLTNIIIIESLVCIFLQCPFVCLRFQIRKAVVVFQKHIGSQFQIIVGPVHLPLSWLSNLLKLSERITVPLASSSFSTIHTFSTTRHNQIR